MCVLCACDMCVRVFYYVASVCWLFFAITMLGIGKSGACCFSQNTKNCKILRQFTSKKGFVGNKTKEYTRAHSKSQHQRWCLPRSISAVDRLCGRQRSTSMRSRTAPRSCTRPTMSCVLLLLATVRGVDVDAGVYH